MRVRTTPLTWILFAVGVLHAIGIGWGLPGSDGWDNDGVAPRDFLPGLAETFTSGHFYTYPPVHLALLAVVTLPITLAGVLSAPSHALADVVGEMLKPGYMTAIAYVARFVSLLMSLGIVFFSARIAEEIQACVLGVPRDDLRVRRAGYGAAALVGVGASLTYYAHTTNLDVPYLFWGLASLLAFARVVARNEPRRLRWSLVFAVLAVATKDQAYALFGLSLPIAFAVWAWLDRAATRAVWKELAAAAALAAAALLVADAIVFNPSGFLARLRFLSGSASQDFVEYTRDWSGRLGVLRDAARFFDAQLPKPAALLFLLGFGVTLRAALAARARRGARLALALLPLLVAVSFTVLFNWVSLRTNARFLMPQAILLSIYGGIAMEALGFAASKWLRYASRVAIAALLLAAVKSSVAVDATLLFDPRYEAEAWLREHVKAGQTIETYGLNVYLPRFPAGAKVIRVGPEPIEGRNPMPGVIEVQDAYERAAERETHWIVLPAAWAWRYLLPPDIDLGAGRRLAPTQERTAGDVPVATWFRRLTWSQDAFVIVKHADYPYEKILPVAQIHGSTGTPIWIYERKPASL